MSAPRPPGARSAASGSPLYPAAAVGWMIGSEKARVLDLGSGRAAFAAMLHDAGHQVWCLDRQVDRVADIAGRLGTPWHVAGQVESLPYLACTFDLVTASQTLHRFAPGLALTEIARVLKPGGHLVVAYNTRDDTVPWVRRLAALIREADPEAMSGDYGQQVVQTVVDSAYFPEVNRRNFRNWVPITRAGLVGLVERWPATARLDPAVRDQLLARVGEVYDTSARPPEPLLLPYSASCWRAQVDHSDLTLDDADDVFQIRI